MFHRLTGLLAALLVCHGAALAQKSSPLAPAPADRTIRGLGESFPAARNISQSTDFAVYRFTKDGLDYLQVNRLDGTVLTVFALAAKDALVLPIGTLPAAKVTVVGRSSPAAREVTAGASSAGSCPCGSQVVYDGPDATIVVVTDSNGQIVQVVVINKKNQNVAQ